MQHFAQPTDIHKKSCCSPTSPYHDVTRSLYAMYFLTTTSCSLENFLLHSVVVFDLKVGYYVLCDNSLQQCPDKKLIAVCDLAELVQQDFDGMLCTLICPLITPFNSNQIKPNSCSEERMAS